MLSFAARHADIVSINVNLREGTGGPETAPNASPERTREKVAWVKEAAGQRFDDLELNALIGFVMITDDATGIAEAMAPHFGISADDALHIPLALLGTIDEMSRGAGVASPGVRHLVLVDRIRQLGGAGPGGLEAGGHLSRRAGAE